MMAMPLEQIPTPKSRSTLVAEQILSAIRSSEYSPGCRLPSEREIAKLTQTSRSCVREALSALQVIGAIESRPGEGTFVCENADQSLARDQAISDLHVATDAIELWRARESLETELLKTYGLSITKAGQSRLVKCLEQMRQAVQTGEYSVFDENHRAFHVELARASRRDAFAETVEALSRMTERYVSALLFSTSKESKSRHFTDSLAYHEGILEAIMNEDLDRAVELLAEHFAAFPEYLRATYALGSLGL